MGVIKKRLLFLPLLLSLLLVPTSASADFATGLAAYERGDYKTAFEEFKRLAQQGYAGAQTNLGFMYDHGLGVPQDYTQAVHWFRKAADQGDAYAQYSLGNMYLMGRGVPQVYAKALKWYRKAAQQGNAEAQNSLGRMYGISLGVALNYVLALLWCNLAASRSAGESREQSSKARDRVAKNMTPSQIAEAQ